MAAAATAESPAIDSDVDDLEDDNPVEAIEPQTEASDATEGTASNRTERMEHCLNVLWMNKNVAMAVDQVFGEELRSPVTEYFFWPRSDAWEELKAGVEKKPWIPAREMVELLNNLTDIITAWEESPRPTAEEVQRRFPNHHFH